MAITDKDVAHIAKLARLKLSDEELTRFTGQFQNILEYVEQLQELDLDDIEPTAQVTGLQNVDRADEVERFGDPKEIIDCSPLPKERRQIKVKSVL